VDVYGSGYKQAGERLSMHLPLPINIPTVSINDNFLECHIMDSCRKITEERSYAKLG